MWTEHYKQILNSAKDTSKKNEVTEAIMEIKQGSNCHILVAKAIKQLKNGKSLGLDGLTSEHVKHGA